MFCCWSLCSNTESGEAFRENIFFLTVLCSLDSDWAGLFTASTASSENLGFQWNSLCVFLTINNISRAPHKPAASDRRCLISIQYWNTLKLKEKSFFRLLALFACCPLGSMHLSSLTSALCNTLQVRLEKSICQMTAIRGLRTSDWSLSAPSESDHLSPALTRPINSSKTMTISLLFSLDNNCEDCKFLLARFIDIICTLLT